MGVGKLCFRQWEQEQQAGPPWTAAIKEEGPSPANSCLYMEGDIQGMEYFIDQPGSGTVPSVPSSCQFVPAIGWLKKVLVFS